MTQFSNPNVIYNSVATGIANQADNHRTVNLTDSVVANFRQHVCDAAQRLVLENQTVSTIEVHESCSDITSGNDYVINAGGDVTFIAATKIVLHNNFRVESGGLFTARIE